MNLTGGPLAYKYQFQEMFFHWGEKVVIMIMMVMIIMLALLMVMVMMIIIVFTEEEIPRVVMVPNTQLLTMLSLQSCRFLLSTILSPLLSQSSQVSRVTQLVK